MPLRGILLCPDSKPHLLPVSRRLRTRPRTVVLDSPSRSDESFSYSTRGTSIWMSIRSNSGPEMRFWYLVTTMFEQVQGLTGSL